jgi:F-type H+-transporting ATPase subunit beta
MGHLENLPATAAPASAGTRLALNVGMVGRIEAVRGSVVDVRFASSATPGVREALRVRGAGRRLLEVQSRMAPGLVRALALQGSSGLARGMEVEAGGGPLTVPVGRELLGRIIDGLGAPLDGGPPIPAAERRSVSAETRGANRPRRISSSRAIGRVGIALDRDARHSSVSASGP